MAAADWIRTHRRSLLAVALRRLAEAAPDERRDDPELAWIVGYNLDLFVRRLDHPERAVNEEDAADLVASAARRAAEGLPIENLLRDYQVGFDAVWQAIMTTVGVEDAAVLFTLTSLMHAHLLAVTTLVLRGFRHESARLTLGERDARYAVYTALLSGNDPAGVALRAGVTLAERYLVLALHMGEPRHGPDVNPIVAQHRRANTVQRILTDGVAGDVFAMIGDPVGTALIPTRLDGLEAIASVRTAVDHIGAELDIQVHAAVEVASVEGIAAAAAQSAEVAEIAVATRRAPGTYTLDALLVEYQLTRPGPGRDRLLHQLAPLDDHPEWVVTLRAYLRHGCDRRRTAAELHLHPNSVDYRLDRLAEACGFDATDPVQRAFAHAALCVRDLAVYRPA